MEYPLIHIDASKRSLGKLKRGGRVRIQGGDLPLFIHPERYDHISKTFMKGKGLHIALSPDELQHNHARGIFGKWGDDALKWVGDKTGIGGDKFKDMAYQVGDMVKPMAKDALKSGINAGAAALSGLAPELSPLFALGANKLGGMADSYLDNPSAYGVGERGGNQPPSRNPQVDVLNSITGENNGKLDKAGIGSYLANLDLSTLETLVANKRKQLGRPQFDYSGGRSMSQYTDAVPATGAGLYGHGIEKRIRRRARESGSIGIQGNLLGHSTPPALRSQPYSANFQFGHTLPPALQAYAKSGAGLF